MKNKNGLIQKDKYWQKKILRNVIYPQLLELLYISWETNRRLDKNRQFFFTLTSFDVGVVVLPGLCLKMKNVHSDPKSFLDNFSEIIYIYI